MTWKPSATSGSVRSARFTRRHGIQTVTRRGFIGTARRFVDRKEEVERCGHAHKNRGTALACAEALCRELNV